MKKERTVLKITNLSYPSPCPFPHSRRKGSCSGTLRGPMSKDQFYKRGIKGDLKNGIINICQLIQ
jgi:hypothetical protein